MSIERPHASEFNDYYARYISKVPATGPVSHLTDQIAQFERLRALPERDAEYRYAEGKWNVKEVIGHMADTERMFSYRLLHIARRDAAALPGMDEKVWSAVAPPAARQIRDVADEMIAVRRATLALVHSLDADALGRTGVASTFPISARALCWILPGHAQHHLDVLNDRYRITT
ncbi:MAG TPA: DinB family protein [Vicinamibacterales bacterium]